MSASLASQRLCRHCMYRDALADVLWCAVCDARLIATAPAAKTAPATAAKQPESPPRPAQLTEREIEVLRLVCQGLPSKVIAHQLGCAKKTVDVHRWHILRKTGCPSLAPLGVWAAKAGLV